MLVLLTLLGCAAAAGMHCCCLFCFWGAGVDLPGCWTAVALATVCACMLVCLFPAFQLWAIGPTCRPLATFVLRGSVTPPLECHTQTDNPRLEDVECMSKLMQTVGMLLDSSTKSVKQYDQQGNVVGTIPTRVSSGAPHPHQAVRV